MITKRLVGRGWQLGRWLPTLFIVAILAGITTSEWLFAYKDVAYGITLALLVAIAIYIVVSVTRIKQPFADCAETLALVPIYILFTSSLPWFFLDQQFLLPAVYLVILALCFWHIYDRKLSLAEVGLRRSGNILKYILLSLCIAIPLGVAEYFIIRPAPASPAFQFSYLLRDLAYMVIFVGIGEELLFRGLIQRELTKTFGWKWGLISASLLFMVMHLSWRSMPELGFTFLGGLLLGYIYYRTKSLIAPIVIHGVGNVVLVSVMPYLFLSG